MKLDQILKEVDHRPFPMPNGKWKYYQEWNKAVFLHWRVSPELLRKHLPDELEIDLIANEAWVSVVAFNMNGIRLRNAPSFPPISNFPEINIRTYVLHKGIPGVSFLSIEAGKSLSSSISRWMSGLPYRYSKMKRTKGHLQSFNGVYQDSFDLRYQVHQGTKVSTLDRWLTERYALFQEINGKIRGFQIHHPVWPLRELEIIQLSYSYPRFQHLLQGNPELAHYSNGVPVLAWR